MTYQDYNTKTYQNSKLGFEGINPIGMPQIILKTEQLKDVRNVGNGVFSPLSGFLRKKDFLSVVNNMRLENGSVWPIPIVLDISAEKVAQIKNSDFVLLKAKKKSQIILCTRKSMIF